MNQKLTIFLIFLVASTLEVDAQKYKYFTFAKEPEFKISEEVKEMEEAVLEKTYSEQFMISSEFEGTYTFNYSARWINSDDAIQENNKVYLAASSSSEFLYQKARVIKSNGDITELKKSDIKEGVYEETEQKYYYYAIEGLEKGSIIETASYEKSSSNYYGGLVYLQEDVVRLNQTFELICPSFLEFAFKSLNKAPEITFDTLTDEYNRWTIVIDSVREVKPEETMFKKVVRQGILFKVDKNLSNNSSDLTSYGSIVGRILQRVSPEYSKKQMKAFSKIGKELKLSDLPDEKAKVQAIENYLKSTIQIIDAQHDDLENVDFILENKAANSTGMTRLHAVLLDLAEVKYELVITTDRSNLRFDPTFEAYLFLDKYIFYFPKTKEYLAPGEKYMRSPLIPGEWTHNYGLFMKEVGVGDVKLPVGKVKFIEALTYDQTKDLMDIKVDFEEDLLNPMVAIEKESTGYSAQYFQPYFHLFDEEETDNMKKTLVEVINEEMEAEEVEVVNVEENDIGSKPFIYRFKTDNHAFVEKAGNDYLFKVGLLIGPQMEMYQEGDRNYDAESINTRLYGRTIKFNIPEGYSIKNLDDLNMNLSYKKDGEENLHFTSNYVQEGNKVTVNCNEFYSQVVYPLSDFEDYQRVINAAADFNKIVLVLEKKVK